MLIFKYLKLIITSYADVLEYSKSTFVRYLKICTCESFKVDQPNDNLRRCVLYILFLNKKLKLKTLSYITLTSWDLGDPSYKVKIIFTRGKSLR